MKNPQEIKHFSEYIQLETRNDFKDMTKEQVESYLKSEFQRLNNEVSNILTQEDKELKSLIKID